MKNISEINILFPPDKGPLEYIGLLTAHIGVAEAEEEVADFVSKKWTEISSSCWEKHYGALDFLIFMPIIIIFPQLYFIHTTAMIKYH